MNSLSNLSDSYREYSLALMMTRLDSGGQKLRVKVTARRRGGEGIVDAS